MGREDQADTAPHESLQPAAHLSGTLSGDPLNLTGAAGASVEETSPNIEQLAAFARCLEPAPLCKPRLGRGPAAGPSSQGGNAHAGPITWRRWRDLDRDRRARVLRSLSRVDRDWGGEALGVRHELGLVPPRFDR